MNWQQKCPHTKKDKVNSVHIAQEIATAVKTLRKRWNNLGAQKAFDPNDPETSEVFSALWKTAFTPQYSPDNQRRIMQQLNTQHPDIIKMMREISHASEREMEKGFAKNMIERSKGYNTALHISFAT